MVKEAVEEAKKEAEASKDEAEEAKTEEASEEQEAETENQTEEKASKKFFGKKDKKDKKDEKIEELTDRLTRQMAEFDNFRKRTEKEKSQMYEVGAKDIIEKILPVVDNFERGLSMQFRKKKKEDPFMSGNGKDLQTVDDGSGEQLRLSRLRRLASGIRSEFPQCSDACGR